MENIYKIKIYSNLDPRGLYPSERRYSASTVLGLGVVHLSLSATALLLASLSLSSSSSNGISVPANKTNEELISTSSSQEDANQTYFYAADEFNACNQLSLAPCIMTIGALAAGLTGLLAWKRWYIDHNIRWFFFMSILSTITSTICVVLTTITLAAVYERLEMITIEVTDKKPNIRFILAMNILIACAIELMWSILSANVAYKGMNNTYADDIIVSKNKDKMEVNTVQKGSKKCKLMTPDILNHFPPNSANSKIAKYLPKIENSSNLPKAESNTEYQERVQQFLSSSDGGDNVK